MAEFVEYRILEVRVRILGRVPGFPPSSSGTVRVGTGRVEAEGLSGSDTM
jgi:hypothetical protein